MKRTLLDMTQDILSSLSSDEVNSISDTTESLQVANIIKQKYFDILNRVAMPDHEVLIQLDPSLDPSIPVLMYVPEGVGEIEWIKYYDNNTIGTDTANGFIHDLNLDIQSTTSGGSIIPRGYQNVQILPNLAFINRVINFNPQETNVVTYSFSEKMGQSYTLNYFNDRSPCYCTIIGNYWILFDSYDSTVDDTLQATKTMAFGRINPTFKMEDSFIPDLAEDQFQLLYNEAKLLAFFELKQQPHQLAAQETQRGWSNVQKTKAIANRPTYFDAIPNYGRWGRGSNGYPRFFKQLGFDK
jgi:hypothetical protein